MSNIHNLDLHLDLRLLVPKAVQASANSAYIDYFGGDGYGANNVFFLLEAGPISTNTVTLELWQATSSGGAGAKLIPGSTLTAVPTTSTGELKSIDLNPGRLDDANGFKYIQTRVTVGSGGSENWGIIVARYNLRWIGATPKHATYNEYLRLA